MERTLKPLMEQANSSEATPVKKEEQLSTESSENSNAHTQIEPSNPLRVDDTEEWLGKCIIIVGAPPPQR